MAEQIRPYIDLQTLSLELPADVPLEGGRFTGEQWQHMVMPPCPKCGTRINADRADATFVSEMVRHYLFGRWECPNECDPRTT